MKKVLLFTLLIFSICKINAQSRYYINSNIGQPFGSGTNIFAMDQSFGVGNWSQDYFEVVNVNALLQPTTCFIYMDGTGNNVAGLSAFLTTNITAMENWVFNGGKLFLNAGPTSGGNINFGFGGTTCNYPGLSNTFSNSPSQAGHPIFNTPFPSMLQYFGNPCSYAFISGGTSTAIATGTAGSVVTELIWGSGRVIFGGMTMSGFQAPQPQSTNFRANIIVYLAGWMTTSAASNSSALCLGQTATLTASGLAGGTYSWLPGNQTGATLAVTPSVTTIFTVVGTPSLGCISSANISLTVNPVPSVSVSGEGTICTGQTATLTANGANTYSWNTGATSLSIAVTLTSSATYTAIGTFTPSGCTGSTTANVVVSLCTGIGQVSFESPEIRVFPNPNSGEFSVELNNGLTKNLQITDISGRVVATFISYKDKVNINIDHLANGIYYIKVQGNKGFEVFKMIKQ